MVSSQHHWNSGKRLTLRGLTPTRVLSSCAPSRLEVLHTSLHAEAEQKESSVHLPTVWCQRWPTDCDPYVPQLPSGLCQLSLQSQRCQFLWSSLCGRPKVRRCSFLSSVKAVSPSSPYDEATGVVFFFFCSINFNYTTGVNRLRFFSSSQPIPRLFQQYKLPVKATRVHVRRRWGDTSGGTPFKSLPGFPLTSPQSSAPCTTQARTCKTTWYSLQKVVQAVRSAQHPEWKINKNLMLKMHLFSNFISIKVSPIHFYFHLLALRVADFYPCRLG